MSDVKAISDEEQPGIDDNLTGEAEQISDTDKQNNKPAEEFVEVNAGNLLTTGRQSVSPNRILNGGKLSPGIATCVNASRETSPAAGSDSSIDDITKRLANNLLTPANRPSPSKYVSMNDTMAQSRQLNVAESILMPHPPSSVNEVAQVHKSPSYTQLSHFDTKSVSHLADAPLDASILTDNRSENAQRLTTRPITDWTKSDGLMEMNDAGTENSAVHEMDVLAAMSGKPTPTALPNVMDGLSDGEVNSEDDDSEQEDSLTTIPGDVFFANHLSVMKNKSPEEVKEVKSAIQSIRDAVRSTVPSKSLQPAQRAGDSSPVWIIRDSYAEKLQRLEEKRKQRMEMEKRYEQEYREQQLEEIYKLEQEDTRLLTAQNLELESVETLHTDRIDYSSEDDDLKDHDSDTARSWGWGSQKKYSKVAHEDDHTDNQKSLISSKHAAQVSNASRIADYKLVTSPGLIRKEQMQEAHHSTSSLNSYSSSSQSSAAPSTVLNRHRSLLSTQDSESSTSSTSSWDSVENSDAAASGVTTIKKHEGDYDTDEETDKLLHKPYEGESRVVLPENHLELATQAMKNRAKEVTVYDPDEPTVLIEGILFRAGYLGSTQLISEGQPSKAMRMMQAQEAVGRIKAPEGEHQPTTDVDLFVSTEKVMVLNTDLKEIMMDHTLRSISYIADIETVLVIMAKRNVISSPGEETISTSKQQKLICHVFETDEAQLIAQSIGQAFQVAYTEFLKANGIDDPGLLKEASYEDILDQQEIMNDELEMFTRKDMQKEVVVPKQKGEPLGVVIVESGWGSVLPTVILANMSPTGAASRCGQLNIGDQIMSVNGVSLVGLPLTSCQEHIKAVKTATAVRLCVVSRPPVVEVLIKRPDRKYQLGFSVQNGVICSLLRGGIAERGGIRVGHRIIEINGQSVVATSHEKIVHMLSTSVGEILMKTMPMAVFRLLTGQEVPHCI